MKSSAAFFLAGRITGSVLPRKKGTGKRDDKGSSRHLRGAVLGIALSIVPFVLVLVVADGMIQGISSRYLETWSWHFQARSLAFGYGSQEMRSAISALRGIEGVSSAFAEIRGPALAVHSGHSAPALIRGLDSHALLNEGMVRYLSLVSGTREIGGREALVGSETAKLLDLKVGDSFVLLSEGSDGKSARTSLVKVKGIVSAGYRDLDELWIFVPGTLADRILPLGSRDDFIGIKVDAPFGRLDVAQARIEAALENLGTGSFLSSWVVRSWKEVERNLFRSFEMTRALLLIIMCLSILVAAANVSSALVMIVLERSRDIAILKATGASSSSVALVFFLAGGGVGFLGSLLGVGLGALAGSKVNELIAGLQWIMGLASRIASWISGGRGGAEVRLLDPAYYLETIPVRLNGTELLAVALFAILLSILASTLPAMRASRLPPLEIMRKT